mmetsp:Transcript_6885/g.12164  ORF Transcript_6885/g.12164 Transcript_6885/m.12164 type:complete len:86 (-) Transcript_6885:1473-1730(-)
MGSNKSGQALSQLTEPVHLARNFEAALRIELPSMLLWRTFSTLFKKQFFHVVSEEESSDEGCDDEAEDEKWGVISFLRRSCFISC